MRNRSRRLFHRLQSKTMRHNILQQPRPAPPSRSLRKIRDLIIFRKTHAQMRKGPPSLLWPVSRPRQPPRPQRSLPTVVAGLPTEPPTAIAGLKPLLLTPHFPNAESLHRRATLSGLPRRSA
jgi:hypothetical protein